MDDNDKESVIRRICPKCGNILRLTDRIYDKERGKIIAAIALQCINADCCFYCRQEDMATVHRILDSDSLGFTRAEYDRLIEMEEKQEHVSEFPQDVARMEKEYMDKILASEDENKLRLQELRTNLTNKCYSPTHVIRHNPDKYPWGYSDNQPLSKESSEMDNKQECKSDTQPDYSSTRVPISYAIQKDRSCCKNCQRSFTVGRRLYCSFDMSVSGLGLWENEDEFDKRLVDQWKDMHRVAENGLCDNWEVQPEPGEEK